MARGGAAAVESSRGRLNDLNVYPVPDGDTGSNLAETARELAVGLEADPADTRPALAAAAKRAALRGRQREQRRHPVPDRRRLRRRRRRRPGRSTPKTLARALRVGDRRGLPAGAAADRGHDADRHPRDGRGGGAGRRPAARGGHRRDARRGPRASVVRTQGMLDVLRDAGVVDAGAAGLLEFCARRVRRAARGEDVEAPIEAIAGPIGLEAVHLEQSRYRYCTSFLRRGRRRSTATASSRRCSRWATACSWSARRRSCKVHVHTDDPARRISAGGGHGRDRPGRDRQHARPDRASASGGWPASGTSIALPGGRSSDGAHDRREHRDRARLDGRPARSRRASTPTWRSVPLTVRFGDEQFRDGVDIDAGGVLRPPARRRRRTRDGGAVARARTPRVFEELADYAHILVLPVSSQVSASRAGGPDRGRHARGRRPGDRARRAHGHRPARCSWRRACSACSRPARTWTRSRRGSTAARERVLGADLRRHARVPAPRRPDQAHVARCVGGALGVRPLLTLRDGAHRALQARARTRRRRCASSTGSCATRGPGRTRGAGRRSRTPTTPPGVERLREIVHRLRPRGPHRPRVRDRRRRRHARRARDARPARAGRANDAGVRGRPRARRAASRGRARPRAPAHLDLPATSRRALADGARGAPPAARSRPSATCSSTSPFRHEDFRSGRPLAEIAPGEEATVVVHGRARPAATDAAAEPGRSSRRRSATSPARASSSGSTSATWPRT